MERARQRELLDRIQRHRADGDGTDTADAVHACPVSEYTDPARLERERALLHREPTLVGLSGLVPEPGCFAEVFVGDRSVVVTRTNSGEVAAMLNVCRHRGAEVCHGRGKAPRLVCPYHGWAYELDGALASRRRGEFFDEAANADLRRLPVAERDGLIWLCGDPDGRIPEQPLAGAESELAPFDLGAYRLFDETRFARPVNWKSAVDTFCEAYHLSVLHRTTLSPMIHDRFALFDRFGPHGRLIAARKSIDPMLDEKPREQWSLLPHATMLWFLVPNSVLIYQQDHVELYQARPGRTPDETHLYASIYVPPDSTESDRHWEKNFELIVSVTDEEDFTTAAGQQRGFHSGAQEEIVFGRNEPALGHFHRSLNERLRDSPRGPSDWNEEATSRPRR